MLSSPKQASRAILVSQRANRPPGKLGLEGLPLASSRPGKLVDPAQAYCWCLLKRLIWGMWCLPCSVMPQSLGFQPLFISLIVAMEIQYLKR